MSKIHSKSYPVIIVDDETTIRQGMVKCIDWSSIGFYIAGEAADGLEAIELVKTLNPAVVLTDIRMQKMDGMELIEWLYNNRPEIKVILISGYSELEYYKKALHCKIFDYLLKPTRRETIKNAFLKLKTTLDEENEKKALFFSMQNRLESSIPLARTNFLTEFTAGMLSEEKAPKMAVNLGIILPDSPYRIVAFAPHHSISDGIKIAERLEKSKNQPFAIVNGIIISFWKGTDITLQKENLLAISRELKTLTKTEFSIAVSSTGTGFESFGQCLNEAFIATNEYLFTEDKNSILNYDEIAASWAHPENIYEYDVSGIVTAVENGEEKEIRRSVYKLFTTLKTNPVPYGYLSCLISRIYYGASRNAWKFHTDIPGYMKFKRKFDTEHNLQSKTDILIDMLLKTSKAIQKDGTGGRLSLAGEIDLIINEHYMQNEMSLSYIAERTNKSEAYISTIYKAERNQSILERITNLRMKKAREELSQSNMKIYEIAKSIGYIDTSYFCKLFRKNEGISPAEYRRTH